MLSVETFQVDHGGARLFTCLWRSTGSTPARGLILVNHGLGEHSGRYASFAEYFTRSQYHVASWDHEGHGQSGGAPGTISSESSLIGETASVRKAVLIRLRSSDLPCVLWGHSMGGLLALETLRRPPLAALFAASVVTNPPLQLGQAPNPLLAALAGPVSAVVPNATQANGLDRQHLSRDPAVIAHYAADPLVHDRVSMRLGAFLLRLPKAMLRASSNISMPLLLMHGERDGISRVEATRKFVELNTGSNVELRVWPELYHEIHNEPERLEVLAFAKTWLDRQLPST